MRSFLTIINDYKIIIDVGLLVPSLFRRLVSLCFSTFCVCYVYCEHIISDNNYCCCLLTCINIALSVFQLPVELVFCVVSGDFFSLLSLIVIAVISLLRTVTLLNQSVATTRRLMYDNVFLNDGAC